MNYQQQAVAGMNPVELIVALYDGMVRFLYQAIAAVERQDAAGRRSSVARVLEILMHLQSRLRMDVGGNSAKALAEFYAAIFALCLEGSRLDSADRLREAIGCIRDVREAWSVAARDPEVLRLIGEGEGPAAKMILASPATETAHSSWSA
ncbi:MAG TPA: flagellar export chaperone FliS [Acidobacteriaceae bacterium]|jgi:flagellar protein FliS|nr:flagellar export chaperone FliS [Acidobacteriaceae bacterium]